ncbi:MAG: regulatory protein RecX [Pleomorphochaeta sp.]
MRYAKITRRENPEGIYVLSKGCSPFFVPKKILLEFNLPFYSEEDDVDEEMYIILQNLNELYLCRKKGLDLLARREHTKLELKAKLAQRKFSKNSIENTLNYLVKNNYLSEERFCESFIISKNRNGDGKYLVLQKLQSKGISSSFSNEIYDDLIDLEMEINACVKAIMKISRRNKKLEKKELSYKLQNKGFSYSIIKDSFEIYFDKN